MKQEIVFQKDKATLNVIAKKIVEKNISNNIFYLKSLQHEKCNIKKVSADVNEITKQNLRFWK